MKQEAKTFRYFAKSLDNGNYVIREAIRFEGNVENNFIYAVYYDDWNQACIKENELHQALATVALFYNNNPEGLLDLCTIEE